MRYVKGIQQDAHPSDELETFSDPFQDLKEELGCEDISDMRFSPWKDQAIDRASRMDVDHYSLHSLEDLAQYLFGKRVHFDSYRQARLCFHITDIRDPQYHAIREHWYRPSGMSSFFRACNQSAGSLREYCHRHMPLLIDHLRQRGGKEDSQVPV